LEIQGNCQVDYWTRGCIISSSQKFMDETVEEIYGDEVKTKHFDILVESEQELLAYKCVKNWK
ncbi:MAG: hypothetical protein MJH11_18455, partial [Lentisphaeria bacterium]|nr:hypothetical protein [Lentisphaeria bacterium]